MVIHCSSLSTVFSFRSTMVRISDVSIWLFSFFSMFRYSFTIAALCILDYSFLAAREKIFIQFLNTTINDFKKNRKNYEANVTSNKNDTISIILSTIHQCTVAARLMRYNFNKEITKNIMQSYEIHDANTLFAFPSDFFTAIASRTLYANRTYKIR